jgi:hypothetical protein
MRDCCICAARMSRNEDCVGEIFLRSEGLRLRVCEDATALIVLVELLELSELVEDRECVDMAVSDVRAVYHELSEKADGVVDLCGKSGFRCSHAWPVSFKKRQSEQWWSSEVPRSSMSRRQIAGE